MATGVPGRLGALATLACAAVAAALTLPEPAASGEAAACGERLAEAPAADAGRRLLQAQCALRRKRFAEAERLVEPLVADGAASADAFLYLGMARFHRGDLDGAERALAGAAERSPRRPELALYRGLVHLARGALAEARAAFARARGLDAERVEPLLSYYEGVAALAAGEREVGVAALRRVEALAPGSAWADAARTRRDRLRTATADRSSTAGSRRPSWWASVSAGVEYDDNVILRAEDVPRTSEISNRRDVRGMWEVDAGYELLRSRETSVGVRLRYSGTAHEDLDLLDVHYPRASLWLGRRLGESLLGRLSYDYGHAWVDGDSLLDSHTLLGSLRYSWEEAGRTRAFARGFGFDYHVEQTDVPDGTGTALALCGSSAHLVCGPSGVEEDRARDRDGVGLAVGVEHVLPLERIGSRLAGGYVFHRYWAEGKEQSYSGHELRVRWRSELPYELRLRAKASWLYRPFRHASTVPDPDRLFLNRQYPVEHTRRRDDVLRASLGLERPVAERVDLALVYSYLENDSNRSVFDYDRQVVGAYLTVRLGRR